MRPPLKLSSIEQEHLQDVYNAAGVPRDHLPYSAKFDELVQGFQDRTFKNAEKEQVFGALLKYVRTGNAQPTPPEAPTLNVTDEQMQTLKGLLPRHAKGGKMLPYSDEVEAARKEFAKLAGVELNDAEFWHAILKLNAGKRRPPARKKAVVAKPEETGGDEDVE